MHHLPRRRWAIAAIVTALFALATTRASAQSTFQEGIWLGSEVTRSDGQFEQCFMLAMSGRPILGMLLNREGHFSMVLRPDGSAVVEGTRYPAVIEVDDRLTRRVQGVGLAELVRMDFAIDPDLVVALGEGRRLEIEAAGESHVIDLLHSGGYRAVKALEACLVAAAGIDASGRKPASAAGSGNDDPVLVMLERFLLEAGYPEPRFSFVEPGDPDVVSWTSQRTAIVGSFANVALQQGGAVATLRETLQGLVAGCGGSGQVLYDATVPSRLPDAGLVYSGAGDCPKQSRSLHFLGLDMGQSLWLFLFAAPSAEAAQAASMKARLRSFLSE